MRGYTVFNAMQIDGLPAEYFAEATPPMPHDEDDTRLTAMFAKLPITVRHGGDRAYYAMGPDVIQMPMKSAFADATQYYATRAHETIHATRHPARLNRDFGQKRFGDHGYALEEVTAEMGAAFIGAQIGLPADHIEDHASYIASWLEALQSNPAAFLAAAAKAQTATDYVLKLMGSMPAITAECGNAILA